MGSFANKTQDKSRSAADTPAKQQGNGGTFQFVDNRPQAVTQRRLQVAADSSAQVRQMHSSSFMRGSKPPGRWAAFKRRLLGTPHSEDPNMGWGDIEPSTRLMDDAEWKNDKERLDKGALTKTEIADYMLLAGAGATGVGSFIAGLVPQTDDIARATKITGATSAGLGALSDLRSGYKSGKEVFDSGNSGTTRKLAAGETLGSLTSATTGTATSLVNLSKYVGSGVAATATTTAGIGGIATGAADIFTGYFGARQAGKRQKKLEEIRDSRMNASVETGFAAKIGAASQGRERLRNMAKVAKGALSIVGGALLLTAAASPVGWTVLAAAAGVGAAAAAINYFRKRRGKEEMAATILGVHEKWKDWKAGSKDVKENPLTAALKVKGYSGAIHFVDNYVQVVSGNLLGKAKKADSPETLQLLKALGLNTDEKGRAALTQDKIAKKLQI